MAGAFVGGALLSAFLQVAIDRLASPEVVDYFRGRKLNEKLLNRFNSKLLYINAVLDDAEQKQIRNQHVKTWLDKVKDAVFEAEDLVDEIDTQVTKCKLKAESQINTSKVWTFFSRVSVSSFDKAIKSRMEKVLDNLEYLASQKDILGLKEASGFGLGLGSGSQVSPTLPTSSLLGETVVYGRDDDKDIIFNWLTSYAQNDNKLSIISIVGMGGMGKTTLAQHLYNDPRMDGEFDLKAWVCVSDEFDVFKLTRAILEAITRSTDDGRDLNMLQERLKAKLTEKKFLLVLDDVWNENRMQWEALQTPLNYGARGSEILVTTRSKQVASAMRSDKMHSLEQLQEKHCWQLFAKHAFQDENTQLNLEFEEIGTKIIEKCKGLPLALKTIGSLLYGKSSISEWKSIQTSEIWDLPEEDSNIIPALRLSYHHLPSHLKRCFAYSALFPKDHIFEKEYLILLWMAENFLQCPKQGKSIEEVGEQYFDDLLSRCFFQRSNGDEMLFFMHDLLNDLAKYVSGDFCFRLEVKEAQNISKMTRHFSFVTKHYYYFEVPEGLCDAKRLRTFLPLSEISEDRYFSYWESRMWVHNLLSKLKFLRVFSLRGNRNVKELPDFICNLKLLRYLDLSGTAIRKLPDSICLLYNLQTLKLSCCHNLEELPLNLHKLTNLRHLDLDGTELRKIPPHLEKLKNLQVLSTFYVGKGSESNIGQLGELNLHGSLSISELQNIVNPSDALAANLLNKIHLVNLHLAWSEKSHDDSQKEREVLEKLQPSKHLKKLSLTNYGGTRFADWFGDNSLSNVVSLKLINCKNCILLPPLGLLPYLKNLSIKGLHGIVVVDAEFYGSSSSSSAVSFQSLETLSLGDMKGWEKWECKLLTSAFPRLRELCIENCPKLKGHLPEQLICLTKLVIYECRQLEASVPWAPTIEELQLEHCGKVQFDYHPSTLKSLKIVGRCMEGSSLERIGHNSLEKLHIHDCPNMNIPINHCYNFLVELWIMSSCESLRTFPLDFFPKLRLLCLFGCINLEMVSQEEHGGNLTSLTRLEIIDCPQLESFCGEGLPSNLRHLRLSKCSKLMGSLKWPLRTNTSLVSLQVEKVDVESFPDQGLLPVSLNSLWIKDCQDLIKLDHNGLCNLSSLTELWLQDCPRLQCLPEEGLPNSISSLTIRGNCPLLKQRCQKPNGQDCGKITHIEHVYIDNDY
ncbi:putative disease resistance RPP13-like protein 1 [Gastrolobium bilobum]|uniref:putative disease resistance RPP13-like protein 1 n=1 Tax=Gastrolobium bilobum TaxID=150636 RepID=UPI002AB03753|nr:putative disease resistance RPP13-like protein 1 [Gastrolobium bilobum]